MSINGFGFSTSGLIFISLILLLGALLAWTNLTKSGRAFIASGEKGQAEADAKKQVAAEADRLSRTVEGDDWRLERVSSIHARAGGIPCMEVRISNREKRPRTYRVEASIWKDGARFAIMSGVAADVPPSRTASLQLVGDRGGTLKGWDGKFHVEKL